MLCSHFTEKLLGLKGVIVKNITQTEKVTSIDIEMELKPHNCPCCGTATRTIHDYRQQAINVIPAFGKHVLLYLKKAGSSFFFCQSPSLLPSGRTAFFRLGRWSMLFPFRRLEMRGFPCCCLLRTSRSSNNVMGNLPLQSRL